MNDYEFLEDKQAYASLLDNVAPYKKTSNMIRLAISLGACIAGGSAVSLLQKKMMGRAPNMRDIDLWFCDQKSMDAFLFSAKMDPEISTKISFGGHAVDLSIRETGWTIPLQVITFRSGTPVEVISQFDFKNCAVAVTPEGFWYQKDVPQLLKENKLSMLNDNSAFFMSRVEKYLRKGFDKLDDEISLKLFSQLNSMLDKVIESVSTFDSSTDKPLEDFDKRYNPIKGALGKITNLASRFMAHQNRLKRDDYGGFFTKEQENMLHIKMTFLTDFQQKIGAARVESYNLPYGYYSVKSSDKSDLDSLFDDI